MKRKAKILERLKRSEKAWMEYSLFSSKADDKALLLAVLESPEIARSGRAMWNLGMWLDYVWADFDRPTRARLLKSIESIMLHANHNRAFGLWKLGDSLGAHLATNGARRVLEVVASSATHEKAVSSALHGLAHYADERPKEKRAVCEFLHRLARKESRRRFKNIINRAIRGIERGSPCGAIHMT